VNVVFWSVDCPGDEFTANANVDPACGFTVMVPPPITHRVGHIPMMGEVFYFGMRSGRLVAPARGAWAKTG